MNAAADDGLFPEPERMVLSKGDPVVVTTMWGEERGTVRNVRCDSDGFPMATIVLRGGDVATLNIARIAPAEVPIE